ncbi:hypothetical protein KZP23_14190 [Echinicola marina]|uniref:hypothetical protein n=1 Tax=Echinicola marina TaxID=2859768 RepID=UPI001CF684E3|nr:hypothetical protein [Echinicola marina]UCS91878.1 hypothetical protein KZP23_14190 [Echinicola marina]
MNFIKAIGLDLKLVVKSVGLGNVLKALKREAKLKKNYPKGISGNYLWFIGVLPENQGEGMGSHLLDYSK